MALAENIDFSNRTELQEYIENRYIVDVDRFTGYLDTSVQFLNITFRTVYDLYGRAVFSFDERTYWVDKEGQRHVVLSFNDLKKAKGNLYRQNGLVAFLARDIAEKNYLLDPPYSAKASALVETLIADVAGDIYNHVIVSREFPSIESIINFGEIHGSDLNSVKKEIASTQRSIHGYLENLVSRYTWKEIFIYYKNDNVVMDVGIDTRIKQWYLNKFEREDIEEEAKREAEQLERIKNGYY